jgi:hypothetical protein
LNAEKKGIRKLRKMFDGNEKKVMSVRVLGASVFQSLLGQRKIYWFLYLGVVRQGFVDLVKR